MSIYYVSETCHVPGGELGLLGQIGTACLPWGQESSTRSDTQRGSRWGSTEESVPIIYKKSKLVTIPLRHHRYCQMRRKRRM